MGIGLFPEEVGDFGASVLKLEVIGPGLGLIL